MHALLTAAALAGGMDNAAREAEAERLLAPLRASRTLVATFERRTVDKVFNVVETARGELRLLRGVGGPAESFRLTDSQSMPKSQWITRATRTWILRFDEKIMQVLDAVGPPRLLLDSLDFPLAVLLNPDAVARHRAVVVKRTPDYVYIEFWPRPRQRPAAKPWFLAWLMDAAQCASGQIVLAARPQPALPAGSPRRLWWEWRNGDETKFDFRTWAANGDEPRAEEFAAPPVPPGWRVVR